MVVSPGETLIFVVHDTTYHRILKPFHAQQVEISATIKLLKDLPQFRRFSSAKISQIALQMKKRSYRYRNVIATYGDRLDHISVIVKGEERADISCTPSCGGVPISPTGAAIGSKTKATATAPSAIKAMPRMAMTVMGHGQIVGEHEVLKGLRSYRLTYEADAQLVEVLEMPIEVYQEGMHDTAALSSDAAQQVVNRCSDLVQRVARTGHLLQRLGGEFTAHIKAVHSEAEQHVPLPHLPGVTIAKHLHNHHHDHQLSTGAVQGSLDAYRALLEDLYHNSSDSGGGERGETALAVTVRRGDHSHTHTHPPDKNAAAAAAQHHEYHRRHHVQHHIQHAPLPKALTSLSRKSPRPSRLSVVPGATKSPTSFTASPSGKGGSRVGVILSVEQLRSQAAAVIKERAIQSNMHGVGARDSVSHLRASLQPSHHLTSVQREGTLTLQQRTATAIANSAVAAVAGVMYNNRARARSVDIVAIDVNVKK